MLCKPCALTSGVCEGGMWVASCVVGRRAPSFPLPRATETLPDKSPSLRIHVSSPEPSHSLLPSGLGEVESH